MLYIASCLYVKCDTSFYYGNKLDLTLFDFDFIIFVNMYKLYRFGKNRKQESK